MFTAVLVLIPPGRTTNTSSGLEGGNSAALGELHYTSLNRLAICSVNMSGVLYRLVDDTFRQRD